MSAPCILTIEDDPAIRRGIVDSLKATGHVVWQADRADTGIEKALSKPCDLVLLDLVLPGGHGLDVLAEIRKQKPTLPVIVLTAKGEEQDRVKGLRLGADDYVVKPFSPKELEARIRCVLRRIGKEGAAGIPNSGLIQINDIRIDTNKRQVFRGDERIRLTGMEFSLLELLVGRSGEPFSRGEILKEVWGYTPERHVDTRVVDVHISRLRSKLEDDPANPELILTARGTGYLFQRIIDGASGDGG